MGPKDQQAWEDDTAFDDPPQWRLPDVAPEKDPSSGGGDLHRDVHMQDTPTGEPGMVEPDAVSDSRQVKGRAEQLVFCVKNTFLQVTDAEEEDFKMAVHYRRSRSLPKW